MSVLGGYGEEGAVDEEEHAQKERDAQERMQQSYRLLRVVGIPANCKVLSGLYAVSTTC